MNGWTSGKSSSGKEAIVMAHEGRLVFFACMQHRPGHRKNPLTQCTIRWDELESYCSRDAALTRELTLLQSIRVPAFGNTSTVRIERQEFQEEEESETQAWGWRVHADPLSNPPRGNPRGSPRGDPPGASSNLRARGKPTPQGKPVQPQGVVRGGGHQSGHQSGAGRGWFRARRGLVVKGLFD